MIRRGETRVNHDKVTELLKNYRSYKYAVSNGIAPHQSEDTLGMPMGGGYGSRPPAAFGARGTMLDSLMDYNRYKRTVMMIEGAVAEVLDDIERDVIEQKYINRNTLTLERIADRNKVCSYTIRKAHKRALNKLADALRFLDAPEIHNLDLVGNY